MMRLDRNPLLWREEISMTDAASGAGLPHAAVDRHASLDKARLFLVSVLALVTAGVSFSIRGDLADTLRTTFLEPINPLKSAEMIGSILGVPFLGFALTIAIGSPLLDLIGMGRLLMLSSLCFITGTLVCIVTPHTSIAYWHLWIGMVITGIGWGLVETVVNPLTATLYPDDKTHKLNVLHAWWPGGIIIGGLIGVAMKNLHVDWRLEIGVVILFAATFGLLLLGSKFPPTERVAAGVSAGGMVRELFRPFFLIWFCSMFLTAASELAPGQWVDFALSRTVHMPGILLLVYVSGLMFIMRHFAGTAVHKLSPVGLLWVSSLMASLGLLCLSIADSPITGLLAATVWGTGVCYMWPTMLAASSERFPRGGALLMGLMGTAGTMSIYFVLPKIGLIYDHYVLVADTMTASRMSFRFVAILPAVLLLVFGAIWLYDRSKGGFKPVKLTAAEELGQALPSEL
jgi:MFS family permease